MSLGSQQPRKTRSDKFTMDNFDIDVTRRTVHEMIERGKQAPTARAIQAALRESINFTGKFTLLRSLLKDLGFVWRKCESNRSVLMERADVAVARMVYLRKIKQYREEGRPIVYTDETYIHTSHCMKKCWQDSSVTMKIPFSKGERLIVVYAGSESGFIDGAALMLKAHTSTGDYHTEMNGSNFQKWLTEKLIPNLPPRSVVVIDNASYHNIQLDKCPTQSARKAEIQAWLDRNNIRYDQRMLKAELVEICKREKPEPTYVLDSTLQQHGHDCLRLPKYHAELNAIELIWSQASQNG